MEDPASSALAELIMYDLLRYLEAKLDFTTPLLKLYVDVTMVLISSNK